MPNDIPEPQSQKVSVLDRSLARPVFMRYCLLFGRRLPFWVPANFVTFGGFLCSMAMLVFLPDARDGSLWIYVALAVLLNLYAISDHLDGWQAKRTRKTSRLGHFLDHGLDFYSSCAVITCTHAMMDVGLWPLVAILVLNALAFPGANVEERVRRVFYFGPIGTLEGILLVTIYYLARAASAALGQPPEVFHVVDWVFVGIALVGFCGSVLGTLRRIGSIPRPFAVDAAILVGATLLAFATNAPAWLCIAVPVLFGAASNSRLVLDNALGRGGPWSPMWLEAACLVGWTAVALVGPADWRLPAAGLFLAVVAGRALLATLTAARRLGGEWVWRNPAPSSS